MGKRVIIDADECIGCESCVEICKESAITVEAGALRLAQLMQQRRPAQIQRRILLALDAVGEIE